MKETRKPSRPHSGPPPPRPAPTPPPPKPPASGKTPPANWTSCAPAPPPSSTGSAPTPPASGTNSASSCRTRPVTSPRHGTPSAAAPSEPNTTSTLHAPNWPSYVPRPQPQPPPARRDGARAARPRRADQTPRYPVVLARYSSPWVLLCTAACSPWEQRRRPRACSISLNCLDDLEPCYRVEPRIFS